MSVCQAAIVVLLAVIFYLQKIKQRNNFEKMEMNLLSAVHNRHSNSVHPRDG